MSGRPNNSSRPFLCPRGRHVCHAQELPTFLSRPPSRSSPPSSAAPPSVCTTCPLPACRSHVSTERRGAPSAAGGVGGGGVRRRMRGSAGEPTSGLSQSRSAAGQAPPLSSLFSPPCHVVSVWHEEMTCDSVTPCGIKRHFAPSKAHPIHGLLGCV